MKKGVGLVAFFETHQTFMTILGGVMATCVTLTAYSFTTFSTKVELKEAIEAESRNKEKILDMIDKRLERMENKIDQLKTK